MYSTREVLILLREANPGELITEDRIRRAFRRGDASAPSTFAGRFAWTENDVVALARALSLAMPPRKRDCGIKEDQP